MSIEVLQVRLPLLALIQQTNSLNITAICAKLGVHLSRRFRRSGEHV